MAGGLCGGEQWERGGVEGWRRWGWENGRWGCCWGGGEVGEGAREGGIKQVWGLKSRNKIVWRLKVVGRADEDEGRVSAGLKIEAVIRY